MKHSAFSLVELSIVLVILGLLTGGILTGQSLIRAAELRSVITDVQYYQTAVRTFQDKYFALPGDMRNATDFWGAEPVANCPGSSATPSTTSATCNGNGDGQLTSGAAGFGHELYRFWQHLANAGLIEGTYTGVLDAAGGADPGNNVPDGKLGNSTGYSVGYIATSLAAGVDYMYNVSYGNTMRFGQCNNFDCIEGALTPEEMWNIDTKIDDGTPGLGNIITRADNGGPPGGEGSSECVNGDESNMATSAYELDKTGLDCSFYIRNFF